MQARKKADSFTVRQSDIWYTVCALRLVNRIIIINYFHVAKAGEFLSVLLCCKFTNCSCVIYLLAYGSVNIHEGPHVLVIFAAAILYFAALLFIQALFVSDDLSPGSSGFDLK